MNIKYGITSFYGKAVIYLDDPVFSHVWYLSGIRRNGEYNWTRDPLYARQFTVKTALKHLTGLKNGADKDWKFFHDSWEAYYREIGA